ncbi:MAG: hypothetical protein HN580_16415 [Deltaproteobacteria bacterium]|nr:hypothetical protein [Deltaproteobacteria bacterium]MBT4090624.1 hypothetical protein [Deltaproteobacteria bacterium]MBT4265929.1 hypothetical protein [Deltaproteobacteria bacterium]MBT4641901.1 hypothetical protein [Deltaproteobacteria bacterium]MBT6501216.1 hypothetical protein [Deltaproteobacteria bacterium]
MCYLYVFIQVLNRTLVWGKVKVTIFTHKINGLTESDFILAAKFDQAIA